MIIGIWKPKGPTSFKYLSQIKKIAGTKKVGHAGTLDPLAEGVLVVAIGRQSTKKISGEVKREKEYIATIKLGENSTTDDEEGEKTLWEIKEIPDISKVSKVLKSFVGKIKQTPPLYSAVKVSGQEAYKLARAGKEFKLKPREVELKELILLNYEYPLLEIKVTTGPGVYIRSLARDIGETLNTGGYVKELIRTRVGDYTKEKCIPMERLKEITAQMESTLK